MSPTRLGAPTKHLELVRDRADARLAETAVPAEGDARLAETAVPAEGWKYNFGWLLMLVTPRGDKSYTDIAPGKSWREAAQIRDELLDMGGYESAWLMQKRL